MHVSTNNSFPVKTFSNFSSAPKDFNKINLVKNGAPHYQLNGGGRDLYIYNNNGGFCSMKEPINYPKPGRMLSNLPYD